MTGGRPLWRVGLEGDGAIVWILGATLGSLFIVEYVGPLASLLRLVPPSTSGWLTALAAAVVTTCWAEPFKVFRRVTAPTAA